MQFSEKKIWLYLLSCHWVQPCPQVPQRDWQGNKLFSTMQKSLLDSLHCDQLRLQQWRDVSHWQPLASWEARPFLSGWGKSSYNGG